MADLKTELAAAKTVTILVTRRRNFISPKLMVKAHEIIINNSLKYLGLILDNRLSFEPHVKAVTDKALGTANILCRMMPNLKGPNQSIRRLIASVAYAQTMYAAPIISNAIGKSKQLCRLLERVHRVCTLRVIWENLREINGINCRMTVDDLFKEMTIVKVHG